MRRATKHTRTRRRWAKSGQAVIVFGRPRTWGGARKNAGRKPAAKVAGVSHGKRETFDGSKHPVHVTLKVVPEVASLRREFLRKAIFDVFRIVRASAGSILRVTDFSVLGNHLHLVAECDGKEALSRGMQGLKIRLAKAINRALGGRKGPVFADRYHARALRTPRETRNALLYVVCNERKHLAAYGATMANDWVDPFSSGAWFDGWQGPVPEPAESPPVAAPETWLRRAGWTKAGPRFRIYWTPSGG